MTWKRLPGVDDDVPGAPVADSLRTLASKLNIPSPRELSTVFENWDRAVGAQVAQHATPRSLVDGVLAVDVDDAQWATQLKWLGSRVVQCLNEEAGSKLVERLDVRQRRPNGSE